MAYRLKAKPISRNDLTLFHNNNISSYTHTHSRFKLKRKRFSIYLCCASHRSKMTFLLFLQSVSICLCSYSFPLSFSILFFFFKSHLSYLFYCKIQNGILTDVMWKREENNSGYQIDFTNKSFPVAIIGIWHLKTLTFIRWYKLLTFMSI